MDRIMPAQIRGGRGASNWSMLDLAKAAGVSVAALTRMEGAEQRAGRHATDPGRRTFLDR